MKDDEATAKQSPTASPGRPMSRKSLSVPRPPSRISMKPSRNAAAQKERQNTIAQESGVSRKRAMAPPKLQHSADRKTSASPLRSARRETCGRACGEDGAAASVMATVSAILERNNTRQATEACGIRLKQRRQAGVVQPAAMVVAR